MEKDATVTAKSNKARLAFPFLDKIKPGKSISSLRETMQPLSARVTTVVMSPDGNFPMARRVGHADDRSSQGDMSCQGGQLLIYIPMSRSEQDFLLQLTILEYTNNQPELFYLSCIIPTVSSGQKENTHIQVNLRSFNKHTITHQVFTV